LCEVEAENWFEPVFSSEKSSKFYFISAGIDQKPGRHVDQTDLAGRLDDQVSLLQEPGAHDGPVPVQGDDREHQRTVDGSGGRQRRRWWRWYRFFLVFYIVFVGFGKDGVGVHPVFLRIIW